MYMIKTKIYSKGFYNLFKLLKFPRFGGSCPVNKLLSIILQKRNSILEYRQFWFEENKIRYVTLHISKCSNLSELRRKWSRESVSGYSQDFKRNLRQCCRYCSTEKVQHKIYLCKTCEVPEFRRYNSSQIETSKLYVCDTTD
jgi:hypothetical protein